jgi:hypothetical protein
MAQGLRAVVSSGPGSFILLVLVVLTVAVLIVAVQGAVGNVWSFVIELVAIIGGHQSSAFRPDDTEKQVPDEADEHRVSLIAGWEGDGWLSAPRRSGFFVRLSATSEVL